MADIKVVTDTSVTFDGHFYDAHLGRMFPEFVIHKRKERSWFHVEITKYTEHEDTSEFCSDEEIGGRVCFTPTWIITLEWRVIATLTSEKEATALAKDINKRRSAWRLSRESPCPSPTPSENQPPPTENGVQYTDIDPSEVVVLDSPDGSPSVPGVHPD